MKQFFIPTLIIAFATSLFAQDDFRFRYGLGASVILNDHKADFRALPGIPNCCPQFTEGSGTGIGAAALVEVPLSSIVFLGARLGYMDHSVKLQATETTNLIVGGNSTPGTFTHTVDATIGSLGLEPRLGVRLFDALPISAGIRFGMPMSKEYEQREVASVGTFLDSLNRDTKSAIRNESSGDIPEIESMLMHAVFSIGYELPLNSSRTTYLVPEVSYALALNDVVKGLTWKSNAITAGISIKFSPLPPPAKLIVYDTVYVTDTTKKFVDNFEAPKVVFSGSTQEASTIETDVITKRTTIRQSYVHETTNPDLFKAKLRAIGLDDLGNEVPVVTQHIEEFIQVHSHPLLSYVFFPTGSAEIPTRYEQIAKAQTASFDMATLYNRTDVEVHRNILNILGSRLRAASDAKISITGYNSDHDVEKKNTTLSRQRAEAVRNYLVNVWGINASRIEVKARNLPEIPSTTRDEDGHFENQRVEIVASDPDITEVFTSTDTTRIPTPPQIRFRFKAEAASPMIKWNLVVMQEGNTIKSFAGTGNPPDSIDWDLANNQSNIPRFNAPLDLKLTLTNDRGIDQVSEATLPTEVRTLRQKQTEKAPDLIFNKFNLVLFGFAKSDITHAHRRVLDQVSKKLKPTSTISIEGYTDRTGNSESNQKLALARATAVSQALDRPDTRVIGIGDKRLLFPNDTPEGRFHCRTVQITVKTPME